MSTKPIKRPETNGLGVAGFITSLVGLIFTCGLLCPIGLLMSFFALFSRPRGFAVAGTIIGAVGSGIWVLVGMAIIFGAEEAHEQYQDSHFAVEVVAQDLERHGEVLEKIERRERRLLSFADIRAKLSEEEAQDPWGQVIQVRATHDGDREIYSYGPDGKEDTEDDIVRRLELPPLK
ncbi:MAG: type II secretion system protein GspG [Planctomycetota bacterium]